MGLDGIELVMGIEERFSISILDQDVDTFQTVGDLHNYVKAHAPFVDGQTCQKSTAVNRVRRALVQQLGIKRSEITLDTPLQSLLPKATRAAKWKSLRKELGSGMPPLRWDLWLKSVFIGVLVLAVAIPVGAVLWPSSFGMLFGSLTIALVLLCFAILLLIIAEHFSGRMITRIPATVTTVRALAQSLAMYPVLPDDLNAEETDEWIWQQVCLVVADVLAVDPKKLTRETRLIEDLSIG